MRVKSEQVTILARGDAGSLVTRRGRFCGMSRPQAAHLDEPRRPLPIRVAAIYG